MGLEHLEEIKNALFYCGAEEDINITEDTRVEDVLAESACMIQLLEKLKIPVKHYISGGGLNQDGIERIRAIGVLNEDSERYEEIIKSKDLFGMVTVLDIDRAVSYERITDIVEK